MIYFIIAIIVAVASGCLSGYVASHKGRGLAEGFLLGFLFGPIGALIVALLPTRTRARRIHTGRSRSITSGMPEYDPAWDRAPARRVDAVEDQVSEWLKGKP